MNGDKKLNCTYFSDAWPAYDKGRTCRYRKFSYNDVFAVRSSSDKKPDDGLIQISRSALFPERSK
jgi:hypothetical protein